MKMTSFAFLMVLALQVQPASAQVDRDEETKQDKAFRVLGWALMGTAATDVLSTQYSLRAGANESVPWVPEGGVGLVAAKSGAAAAAWWLTDRLHKDGHKKTALVTRIAIVALWGYVTVHNIRVGNELREKRRGAP